MAKKWNFTDWYDPPTDVRGVPVLRRARPLPSRQEIGLIALNIAAGLGLGLPIALWFVDRLYPTYPAVFSWKWSLVGVATAAVVAWRLSGHRRHILRLTPAGSLAVRFGTDPETLEQLAAARGIKPHYNINGVDYYNAEDFGEAAVLLRASDRSHDFLQPAVNHQQADPSYLVRAATPNEPNMADGERS